MSIYFVKIYNNYALSAPSTLILERVLFGSKGFKKLHTKYAKEAKFTANSLYCLYGAYLSPSLTFCLERDSLKLSVPSPSISAITLY